MMIISQSQASVTSMASLSSRLHLVTLSSSADTGSQPSQPDLRGDNNQESESELHSVANIVTW